MIIQDLMEIKSSSSNKRIRINISRTLREIVSQDVDYWRATRGTDTNLDIILELSAAAALMSS